MDFKPLRDHILQLAISGQIVPQLDSEPEVKQLGSAPAPEDVPFEVPEKWKWVQAKYLGDWKSGATPSRNNAEFWEKGTVPWLKTGEISNGVVLSTEEFVTEKAVKQARLRLNPAGSVLVAMYGTGTVGNIGMLGFPSTTNQACCACITNSEVIVNWYLFYALLAFRKLLINKASGTTNLQNLSKDKIEKTWIPVPPLAEQHRIAAMVDDLFAHLEQMEAAYSEFAGPMTEHFRNTALQMAISGQLVPQLDSEPEVKQIGTAPEKVPFAIPEKWKWVQLNSVGQIVGGGTPSSTISEYWENPAIVWITPTDLGKVDGAYISEGARGISQLGLNKSSARLIPAGSVIYTSRGACIGDLAIATKECCTNQGCKSLVPDIALITSKWAYYALKHATPTIRNLSSGTTFAEISGKKLGNVWIPLPPLAEQRRIVAKLEDLFSGVDKLGSLVAFT